MTPRSAGMSCACAAAETMLGTVRGRHLLTHGPLIVRLFGFRAYFRCVIGSLRGTRGRPLTFLGAVIECSRARARKLTTSAPVALS